MTKKKNGDFFETQLKPELIQIIERYRESNEKQRMKMLNSLDDFTETLQACNAKEYLTDFRRVLSEIN